jgi:sugar phosphate isomerase/epimerase
MADEISQEVLAMSTLKTTDPIRVGTILPGAGALRLIPQIAGLGFESFELTFSRSTGSLDLPELARAIREAIGDRAITISSLGVYGNPLTGTGDDADTLASWRRCIAAASDFGTDLVCGFAGRLPDRPIEESIPRFKEVFGELARFAAAHGVRLAFENCDVEGDWWQGNDNIAHNPAAWQLMFDALPDDNIGLEWEPCHQLIRLIDPIPQLRRWAPKVFHVHGKDATIAWDVLRESGIHGPKPFAWHRTAGFGDSNWRDIITILRQNHFTGSIDIEGYHDPVYRGELEWTGQASALSYLKACRGGEFISVVD